LIKESDWLGERERETKSQTQSHLSGTPSRQGTHVHHKQTRREIEMEKIMISATKYLTKVGIHPTLKKITVTD
jgi:hypothetical protein